jgi:hypothetical protein
VDKKAKKQEQMLAKADPKSFMEMLNTWYTSTKLLLNKLIFILYIMHKCNIKM